MITAQSVCNTLNRLYQADPQGIHALIVNRVPTTEAVADDLYIICEPNLVIPNKYSLGLLGILNGILWESGDPEVVAMQFTESEMLVNTNKIPKKYCDKEFIGFITTKNYDLKRDKISNENNH